VMDISETVFQQMYNALLDARQSLRHFCGQHPDDGEVLALLSVNNAVTSASRVSKEVQAD
jgi:hypothetical protein